MPCTGLCKATGLGRACPSLCKWMLGSEAALRLSTPEHDKSSHHFWLEAWRGYEVLVLVAPGCCGSVAQSLRLQEPVPGAVQMELGGQGHLPIHAGSRSRKAAVVRERSCA